MTVTPTLVLPPRFTSDSIAMRKAALERGWDVFRMTSWRAPAALRERRVVLYGEPLFAAVVAEGLGITLIEPPHSWLPGLPLKYQNRSTRLISLVEARGLGRQFYKPAGDKCFPAGVYENGADIPHHLELPDELPVLISEPVHWELEFRAFVKDRRILSSSPYLRNGELTFESGGEASVSDAEHEAAREFLRSLLSDERASVPAAVVIDVGLIRGRGWAVVEANAAWGSGIYGCDPKDVLTVLESATQPLPKRPGAERK